MLVKCHISQSYWTHLISKENLAARNSFSFHIPCNLCWLKNNSIIDTNRNKMHRSPNNTKKNLLLWYCLQYLWHLQLDQCILKLNKINIVEFPKLQEALLYSVWRWYHISSLICIAKHATYWYVHRECE